MAKGGRRRGANRGQQQRRQSKASARQTAKPVKPPTEKKADIEKALEDAVAATGDEVVAPSAEPKPPEIDLDRMWKMVEEARHRFQEASRQHEESSKELKAQREDFNRKSQQLDEQKTKLEQDKRALEEQASDLGVREIAIREREADAERGFEDKRSEMLAQYDDVIAKRRQTLDERESELHEREDQLQERSGQLAIRERKLKWSEEDVQDQERELDGRVERLIAGKQEEYRHHLAALKAERDQARQDRDRHAEGLRRHEEADRKLGQRSPEEVISELDRLKRENDTLQAELAARPDADAVGRLAALDQEQQSWQAERLDLTRQVSKLKHRLAYADSDAGEREAQRDRIASLVSQQELLRQANEELRTEMGELVDRRESQSPFPACMDMDDNEDLRHPVQADDFGSLRELAEEVRARIAKDSLYYTEADIRSFIGGLAMGRLTLLQGISGTGKTSLPLAFANAVGTKASIVEVQAGWRDPQDLVGHYNSFEKRFYEKEFLKALYRASAPRWKDTIQIVLLDEMNLSYPEQYFSDMLSALELQEEEQRMVLMTHAVSPAPSRLRDGSWLPIPPNVWFVGTANHDETTMDFADKTYDRAHVMEFPHKPKRFASETTEPRHPVSFHAFQGAVDAAVREHAKQAEKVQDHLEQYLREPLANHFEIGWGPRLGRQIERYVPVVIAAGGTIGEAADHVLAMRLLRKLKNRHNNRPEHLDDLKAIVERKWEELGRGARPAKSIRVLDSELRRVGRDEESTA